MWRASSATPRRRLLWPAPQRDGHRGRLTVSPPDANWEAPYSALLHLGASAPGG